MKPVSRTSGFVLFPWFSLYLLLAHTAVAQTTPPVSAATSATVSALPPFVRFSGTARDLNGSPLTGVVGITFSLWSEQSGGTALWLETQNATADSNGHYTVLLGATKREGLPAELFTSEQAHWLGVQVSGQAEQPRVLLVSAPYALKAGDAETLGGLPPSAFVLAAPVNPGAPSAPATTDVAAAPAALSSAASSAVTTTGGSVNAIPLFTTATNIQNSILTQTASTAVNVGGKLNLPSMAAATKTAGTGSRPLDFVASSFSSTTSTAVNQTFQWQAEPAANDTANPSGTLNLLYGLGATAPSETGMKLSNQGIFTFAAGQTFPGTGDGSVTTVASGLGLKGGPITKTGTLSIDATVVPQLSTANTFASNQTINGSLTVGNGAGIGASSGNQALFVVQLGSGSGVVSDAEGSGNGVVGSANIGNGVVGKTAGSAGYGVEGTGPNVGVYGSASAASASYGVYGTGPNVGVFGNGTGAGGIGLDGHGTFIGAKGVSSLSSGVTAGIYGQNSSSSGYGVEGTSPNVGVYGASAGASKEGASGETLQGIRFSKAGVRGDTGGAADDGYVGVVGTADNNNAAVFANNGDAITVWAENDESTNGLGAIFVTMAGVPFLPSDSYGICSINVSGDLVCNGTVQGAVSADGGARKVALYAMQSPENWFEDAGSGQLSNGSARIELDPTFAQTVNPGFEYHVFLTPNGDSKGLYVSQKAATSFEVHEQGGGRSNIAFDYRIMAKRKGYEQVRFADLTEQFRELEAHRGKNMQGPVRPSAAPPTSSAEPMRSVRTALQPVSAQPR
jgi:hypothetical protein